MKHDNPSKLIDLLGGTVEVAHLCCVSSQAVSKWRKEGIPDARMMFLRLARLDVFDEGPHISNLPVPGMAVIPVVISDRRADDRRDHERRDGERRGKKSGGAA